MTDHTGVGRKGGQAERRTGRDGDVRDPRADCHGHFLCVFLRFPKFPPQARTRPWCSCVAQTQSRRPQKWPERVCPMTRVPAWPVRHSRARGPAPRGRPSRPFPPARVPPPESSVQRGRRLGSETKESPYSLKKLLKALAPSVSFAEHRRVQATPQIPRHLLSSRCPTGKRCRPAPWRSPV